MKFDLSNIKNKVLVKYPFFGNITTNVKYHVDNDMPTAYTDGTDIFYNEEFMDKLTVDEQVFVLAHEICHIAFNHIKRLKDRDMDVWNLVTDAVINAFLHEDNLPIIEGGIDLPWASEYNADDLYDVFIKDKELFEKIRDMIEQNMPENMKGQQKPGSGKSFGHDSHSKWRKQKQNNESSDKDDKDKKDQQQSGAGNNEEEEKERRRKKRIENEQEALEEDGEKKAFDKNKKEKKDRLEKMKEEINNKQVSHEAGNQPSSYLRKLGEIGKHEPIIDWRYALRDSITYDLDWSYKNASIEDNILKANLEEIPHAEVEIVLDTSGSIDSELLKAFLRECKNIMLNAKVKVGCFDTKFYGFHQVRNEADINNLEFAGGGGTNFDVAVGAFTRKVVNKIIFTDGYASMPKETVKAIWVVFGRDQINPPGGKVIYVDYDELMKKRRK